MVDPKLRTFVEERNRAFETLDLDWVRRMLPQASSDEVRIAALHKARYECVMIAPALRRESRQWLEERGLGRAGGLDWPPGDALPS